jgi:type I restriction enzyme S subunit
LPADTDTESRFTIKSLADVAEIVGGGTPRASRVENFSTFDGHPWITPSDMTGFDGKFISRGRRFLTDEGLASCSARYIPSGSVLCSSRAPIGYVAIAAVPVTTNQGFRSLIPGPEVTSDYLYYVLQAIKPIAERAASGTTFAEISGRRLGELPIAVPTLARQNDITSWLDQLYAASARIIDDLTEVDSLLARADAALTEAIIQGAIMTNTDGESADESNGSGRIELNDFVPPLPDHRVPIRTLSSITLAMRYGMSRKGEQHRSSDRVPILRMGNIRNGELDLSDLQFIVDDAEAERFVLEDGDLLFNRTNSPELVGKSAAFRWDQRSVFASYLIRVKLMPEVATPEWVALWLNSTWGRRWAHSVKADGVSQSNINSRKLAMLPVPIPAITLQDGAWRSVQDCRLQIRDLADNLAATRSATEATVSQALGQAMHVTDLWAAAALTDSQPHNEEGGPMSEVPVVRGRPDRLGSRRDLVEVVQEAGGSCSPFELWQGAGYADDIDEFYDALRRCVEEGTLLERNLSRAERMIEVSNENRST